jgi:putative tricarboxylic transport membrane protein
MTTGRSLRVGESILGGVVLGLGLFIVGQTATMDVSTAHAAIGPRLFPFLVGAGLLIVGALVLRQAWFGHIAHERGFELDWSAFAIVAVGLVVQILLIERLGWIISTTILFAAVAYAFGNRRHLLGAVIGVVMTALVFVIFNYGLGLSLPVGTVFEQLLGDDEAE